MNIDWCTLLYRGAEVGFRLVEQPRVGEKPEDGDAEREKIDRETVSRALDNLLPPRARARIRQNESKSERGREGER